MKKVNAYKNVKKFVHESGYKQKYLAEKLDINSVEMSNLLNGKAKLTADKIVNIAHVLNSTPNEILGYKELKKFF